MTQGFSGDKYFKEEFKRLIDEYGVKTVIETGTHKGDTTVALSEMVYQVYSIEINEDYAAKCAQRFKDEKRDNIILLKGDAPELIGNVIRFSQSPMIVFLDSHWYKNPLRQELVAIKETGEKPILIIHDMKNPDHPEMGFDTYPDQDIVYDWDLVKEGVEGIYGPDGYDKSYNSVAGGSNRGILYIIPKQDGE